MYFLITLFSSGIVKVAFFKFLTKVKFYNLYSFEILYVIKPNGIDYLVLKSIPWVYSGNYLQRPRCMARKGIIPYKFIKMRWAEALVLVLSFHSKVKSTIWRCSPLQRLSNENWPPYELCSVLAFSAFIYIQQLRLYN